MSCRYWNSNLLTKMSQSGALTTTPQGLFTHMIHYKILVLDINILIAQRVNMPINI